MTRWQLRPKGRTGIRSVKALTAFPQVLAQMNHNLTWTTDVGNAYYNQPRDVMQTVQVLRQRAQAAGTLQNTPQEAVNYDQGNIELAPPNPQEVYVPSYNPWNAYGDPISPYPGFSLLGALQSFAGSGVLPLGLGIAMNAFSHTGSDGSAGRWTGLVAAFCSITRTTLRRALRWGTGARRADRMAGATGPRTADRVTPDRARATSEIGWASPATGMALKAIPATDTTGATETTKLIGIVAKRIVDMGGRRRAIWLSGRAWVVNMRPVLTEATQRALKMAFGRRFRITPTTIRRNACRLPWFHANNRPIRMQGLATGRVSTVAVDRV